MTLIDSSVLAHLLQNQRQVAPSLSLGALLPPTTGTSIPLATTAQGNASTVAGDAAVDRNTGTPGTPSNELLLTLLRQQQQQVLLVLLVVI